MTRSMLAVISDLEGHVDAKDTGASKKEPIQGTATGLIACVAGRGPFDDVVSAMLAQLLARRGIAARRIPHAAVSRETIAQLDLSTFKVITVSYLELGGAPAHLRYLIRRLRHRAPDAKLIAGLWSQDEAMLNNPQAQTALGCDRYVASLRDAIDASVAAPSSALDRRAPQRSPKTVLQELAQIGRKNHEVYTIAKLINFALLYQLRRKSAVFWHASTSP